MITNKLLSIKLLGSFSCATVLSGCLIVEDEFRYDEPVYTDVRYVEVHDRIGPPPPPPPRHHHGVPPPPPRHGPSHMVPPPPRHGPGGPGHNAPPPHHGPSGPGHNAPPQHHGPSGPGHNAPPPRHGPGGPGHSQGSNHGKNFNSPTNNGRNPDGSRR